MAVLRRMNESYGFKSGPTEQCSGDIGPPPGFSPKTTASDPSPKMEELFADFEDQILDDIKQVLATWKEEFVKKYKAALGAPSSSSNPSPNNP